MKTHAIFFRRMAAVLCIGLAAALYAHHPTPIAGNRMCTNSESAPAHSPAISEHGHMPALAGDGAKTVIAVRNPIAEARRQETVELEWSKIADKGITAANVTVYDVQSRRYLVTQVVHNAAAKPELLLFQSDWAPQESKTFWVSAVDKDRPAQAETRTFAMYVPQRMDDFAWESDRIAFRMYGKALEAETVSSGVDVWVKSVRYPVIEKWYTLNDYHKDHGEGLDFYKVGPTRGCGGLAVWHNGELYGSRNYRTHKVIANGPLRTIFELGYEPWQAGDRTIREVKRISIDLGSNLSRFESRFQAAGEQDIELAMGIVKVEGDGEMTYNLKSGWLAYYPPADPAHGRVACGVVTGAVKEMRYLDHAGHGLLIARTKSNQPWIYYAGAGWSKSGDFPDRSAWTDYVEHFCRLLSNPLTIDIVK